MIVQSFAHFEITSTFITDWQAHGSASEDRLRLTCGSSRQPRPVRNGFTEVSNFGRQLTRSRHLEKEERMACDVDTGAVFKHPVHCFGCDQPFYFTLRKIAEAKKLACPLCGSDINLTDEAYGFVVTSVRETIALIDQSSPSLQRASIASPWS
jgi:hypothetical protein